MKELANPQKAQQEQRFFKTYDGGYGAVQMIKTNKKLHKRMHLDGDDE